MIEFKTTTERDEFATLREKNFPLVALMESLDDFVRTDLGKNIVVTEVFRSKADQERIYGAGTTRTSPHMTWKAVDIRDWIYEKPEKERIIQFLKDNFDEYNLLTEIRAAKSKTVWLHAVGNHGMHFHIQYHGPLVYAFSGGLEITA